MNRLQLSLIGAVCLAVIVCTMVIYQRFEKSKMRFAVVDLTLVVRKNQEQSIRVLADPTVDDKVKKTTLAASSDFGKAINNEVVSLSEECGCVLLMREAIIAGKIDDLTPRLMAKLKLR